jgi:hypothetical protein
MIAAYGLENACSRKICEVTCKDTWQYRQPDDRLPALTFIPSTVTFCGLGQRRAVKLLDQCGVFDQTARMDGRASKGIKRECRGPTERNFIDNDISRLAGQA